VRPIHNHLQTKHHLLVKFILFEIVLNTFIFIIGKKTNTPKMKKYLLIFLICFISNGFCQNLKTTHLNIERIGQIYNGSCWAASTGMVLNYFNPRPGLQCNLIGISGCPNPNVAVNTKLYTEFKKLLSDNFNPNFKIIIPPLNRSFLPIYTNAVFQDSLAYAEIKAVLDSQSPLINWKRYSGGLSHITVWDGYEHSIYANNQMKLIYVKDSWPKKRPAIRRRPAFEGGSEYIITNEFYKKPIGIIINDNPVNSLFYNIKPKSASNIVRPVYKFGTITPSATGKNIVTTVGSDTSISLITQANKVWTHLKFKASNNTLKYIGITPTSKNSIAILPNNYLKVIYIHNQSNEKVDIADASLRPATYSPLNVYDELLTIFDKSGRGDKKATHLVPLQVFNKNKSVIAFEITDKNEWFTTRLEKYKGSLLEVVNDVVVSHFQSQNEGVKTAYLYLNYNNSSDYIIIEPNDTTKKPILVDLFSNIDYFENPDFIAKTGAFNFSSHLLDEFKANRLIKYISNVTTYDVNSSRISKSARKIIEACQKIIALKPADQGVGLNGRYFLAPNILASEYNNGNPEPVDSLTFFIRKDIAPSSPENIITLLFQTSPMLESNINTYLLPQFQPPTVYQLKNDVSGRSMQLFFVPVDKYKNTPQKKYSETIPNFVNTDSNQNTNPITYHGNLGNLLASSIPIDSIASIVDYGLEVNSSYMNSHKYESDNYINKNSSKGIIVKLLLKNGIERQCYLLCDYDSTNSGIGGWLKWKE
jgi:hypothetical protein